MDLANKLQINREKIHKFVNNYAISFITNTDLIKDVEIKAVACCSEKEMPYIEKAAGDKPPPYCRSIIKTK